MLFLFPASLLTSCGSDEPEEWYSYMSEDFDEISVKVLSSEITGGQDNDDVVKVKMLWRNDGDEKIEITNQDMGLAVLGVFIPAQSFPEFELNPGEEKEQSYTFSILKNIKDTTAFKLYFKEKATLPIRPERK